MAALHVLSNRTAADPAARAGGLAVAVWEALEAQGGSWIGWSGDLGDAPSRETRTTTEGDVTFVLSDLTPSEHDGYYIEYANRVIWPVFHYRTDLAHYGSDAFSTYADVNHRFAAIAAARARPGEVIWAHDYHFLLAGESLRQEGWTGPVGFFLHIPFPSPELFATIPQHHRLARALCHYDVIGFQSAQDRNNFARYLCEACDASDDGEVVHAFGREIVVKPYPIGIDPAAFRESVGSAPAREAVQRISKFLGGRALVLGVDRMDYSKGLPQRFAAVGRLFDDYPDTRQVVSVTQIAPPSRSKVEEYRELRKELDELAGRINGDYGDIDWLPLRYLAKSYDREELAGLFSIARVALVTPLRDGMNLVAKEFVAAQNPDDPGVLILSQFAGAAEQMKEAVIVNPHDAASLADAIREALKMGKDERQRRHRALYETIESKDIAWWRGAFLDDLRSVRAPS